MKTLWNSNYCPGNRSGLQEITLLPGDAFYIPPGRIHQPWALEDSEIIEFSTTHFDEDSYRLIKRRLNVKI